LGKASHALIKMVNRVIFSLIDQKLSEIKTYQVIFDKAVSVWIFSIGDLGRVKMYFGGKSRANGPKFIAIENKKSKQESVFLEIKYREMRKTAENLKKELANFFKRNEN